jgi:D-alanyl-D-alanine carboxypeptidase/D-alanyl-D-alanine-endopeptidase (penicillin-binding protein 4)
MKKFGRIKPVPTTFINSRSRFFNFVFIFIFFTPVALGATSEKNLENALKNLEKSGTHVSARLVNLTNTREILNVNGDAPLSPASSIKLFTAYTALKRLGINYEFKTDVYRTKDQGLCIKGGGDPSFVMEDLYLLVQALKRKGIESYSGKITLDASAFDDELYPEDRNSQDSERAYNAPISGLNFNYNTITVFVNPTTEGNRARAGLDWPFDFVQIQGKVMTGSSNSNTNIAWDKKGEATSGDQEIVTLGGKIAEGADEWHKPFRIRDPSRAFGQATAKMLADSGIVASAKASVTSGTCAGNVFYSYQSKPLSFIVQLMDKYSNNFIADSLVKVLDHEVNRHAGTTAGGMQFIRDELKKIGIDASAKGRHFVTGSGLTDGNQMAAADFIKLLQKIHQEKLYLPEMFASLPIAGIDGTLKRKFVHSEVEDRLRGKTGSLTGVHSFVGVYPNKEGEWIGIAILVNGSREIPEAELAKFLSTL